MSEKVKFRMNISFYTLYLFAGLQFFIFGLLCLSGGLLGCWLPETRNKPLPESIREMLLDKEKKMEALHV